MSFIDRMTRSEWEEFERRTFEELKRARLEPDKSREEVRRVLEKIRKRKEQRRKEILEGVQKGEILSIDALINTLPCGTTVLPARVRLLKTGLPEISEREIKAELMRQGIYKYKQLIPFKKIQEIFYLVREWLIKDGYKVENFGCPPIVCILLNRGAYKKWSIKTYGLAERSTKKEYGYTLPKTRQRILTTAQVSFGFNSFLIVLLRRKEKKRTFDQIQRAYLKSIVHELLHIFEAYLKLPPGALTKRYGL